MADTKLFARLKRLFSSNVVVRSAGGSRLKVADTSRVQAFTNRQLHDRFNRVHYRNIAPYAGDKAHMSLAYQGARLQLFRDYDIMDNDAIIASALDIYADEVTVKSENGESLIIESPNEQIREILHNLFYDVLNIEFNLWPWVRNMCKYGDHFLYLEIAEKYGIINVMPLPVYETVRIEGDNPENPYEVYFNLVGTTSALDRFENYEIAHFRLLSDSNFLPYGKAMIEPGRRTWKQLVLMEDAMLVHRLVRAPDRRIFRVDIGNIPPQEVDAFMTKMMDKVNKTPLIDPTSGDYNLKFNIMNMLEDFYLPVRGGDSGTQIETLNGLAFTATEDIEYLRNKMMGSLKIPRAFLGYEEMLQGKATLAAEDVRFARTIERIQRITVSELTKIAIIHLYAQGYTDEELINFELTLTNPSTIYEQEKIALWQEKVNLAQQVQELKLIGSDWIYENVFNMSEGEIEEHRNTVVKDTKRTFRLMAIEQGEDPANPTGASANPAESPEGGDQPSGPADLSGLPSEDDVSEALDLVSDEEYAENGDLEELGFPSKVTGGRPREGRKLGTDDHPYGRDPLGDKENHDVGKPFPEDRGPTKLHGLKKRGSFTRENYLQGLEEKFQKNRIEFESGQLSLLAEDQRNGKRVLPSMGFVRIEESTYLDEEILDLGFSSEE